MRIIGGKYKGRIIGVSRNFKGRPTTDFARESLFNILNNTVDFETISVLDLFGGSGSISFEFASRGCPSVDVVDIDFHSLKAIDEMVLKLRIKGIRTIRSDGFAYLKSCRKKYGIIFADPPFAMKELPELPERVLHAALLEKEGRFILEHPKEYDFSGHPHIVDHRKYGNVHFSFFREIAGND
ncbi:MAG: putative methyltransferase [Bacteroidetes bacterium]|nr:putative methyltransferase [Bacteroidota bacterium]